MFFPSFILLIPLPVLYGCETWSLTLREESRRWVFENKVPRRIFGPKRDEATREWRKLHNEQLNDPYCSPNIFRVIKSRRIRWRGHVTRMGERRVVYKVLVGKPEGKKGHGLDRSGSGYEQEAGTCESGNELSGSIKCGEIHDQLKTG